MISEMEGKKDLIKNKCGRPAKTDTRNQPLGLNAL
jgi:hypothetical protein